MRVNVVDETGSSLDQERSDTQIVRSNSLSKDSSAVLEC